MRHGYYNDYSGAGEAVALVVSILGFMLIFALALGIAIYLFNAIGLYNMSKRRGYKNAWLAFIPVASSYVLGGIADNINSCGGKKTNHRITLLILEGITVLSGIITTWFSLYFLRTVFEQAYYYDDFSYSGINSIMGFSIFSMAVSAVAIAYAVFYFICCYKIFCDYSNNNGALFLVLSILFSIAPFVIFALRNKQPASLTNQGYGYPNQGQPNYQQQPPYQYQQAPHQGQPVYPQPPYQGQPNYQQPPYPGQPMYPQAQQPTPQNGWYQQAPSQQPSYPQAQPQNTYQQPQPPVYQPTPPAQPQPPVYTQPPVAPIDEPIVNSTNESDNVDQ